jgi:crotonobetainyl-CoA:carnitine CoA-transferase CaiB-like acyl-CoA transferase
MSSGIAEAGMNAAGAGHPVPLPVQALDHATGYLMAASALTGLGLRRADGAGSRWRTSLARMARLLTDAGTVEPQDGPGIEPEAPPSGDPVEQTPWGDARRLPPPVVVAGAPLHWSVPAGHLGASVATWLPL